MTTPWTAEVQVQLDGLRAGLEEIARQLLNHQRELDYLTSRVLATHDRDVPEAVDSWNRTPAERQLADGALDLAAPSFRLRHDEESPIELQPTRVDVRAAPSR